MHVHAEIFRAIADGKQVLTKPPYDHEFVPLSCASSSALHALHNPAGMVPGGWQFKVATEEEEE